MSKKLLLAVSVQQANYVAPLDGIQECVELSIRVSVIRVVRAVTEKGLKECKELVDGLYGPKVVGQTTINFLTDEAGIGRIAKLIFEQQELAGRCTAFQITNIQSIGQGVIV